MAEKSQIDLDLISNRLADPLREFSWGAVFEITYANRPSIFVIELGEVCGTLYEYLNSGEFQADRQRVLNFGDGAAGAGVRANDLRPTPVLSGSATRQFPPDDILEGGE